MKHHNTRSTPHCPRIKKKLKEVVQYPEGGGHVYWLSDNSYNEKEAILDSNKENIVPPVLQKNQDDIVHITSSSLVPPSLSTL